MTDEQALNKETIFALKETLGEIFDELRDAFIEDGEILIKQADEAMTNADYTSLASYVHTLKSSAKNIGADGLGESCLQLEDLLVKGDYQIIEILIPEMSGQMESVKKALLEI
ncbi:MAG: Unknown protein [uncultured Thiotrichaceae bacterium]|uniref:HPt domain-containing protein n=1 Tax=uncultured Thiotrichaceae bacterium TaxID=298394 RepID=A0A6S6T896_9GAMM|nr:MAG: Unknown protein [uncultured Thiotrichaceae bacterium]